MSLSSINMLLQWPLPNVRVSRDQEASMNHILKDVRQLSRAHKAVNQGAVPSS